MYTLNSSISQADCFKRLAQGALALTPNRRLSQYWRDQYAQWQVAESKVVWTAPSILPWQTWLKRAWFEQAEHRSVPLLLDPFQQFYLWYQVIARSAVASDPLLDRIALTELSIDAWDKQHAWQLAQEPQGVFQTEEVKAFQEWQADYQSLCDRLRVIDESGLPAALLSEWVHMLPDLPDQIILIAFDEFSPIEQQLIHFLSTHFVLLCFDPSVEESTVWITAAADEESELFYAAHWAKALIEKGERSIACVVPNLIDQAAHVRQVFQTVLSDQTLFNISAGVSALTVPIISTAISILSFMRTPISYQKISHLFASVFIDFPGEDSCSLAQQDKFLNEMGLRYFSIDILMEAIQSPAIRAALLKIKSLAQNKSLSMEAWMPILLDCLAAWGWPGQRITAEEEQAIQKLFQCLHTICKLDVVAGEFSIEEVLFLLEHLLNKTIFHPATPQAPLQILGMLEASGIPFDHLWVVGMHSEQLPSVPKLNPFLSIHRQMKAELPHASAAREFVYAQRLIDRYQKSARDLIFSFGKQGVDKARQLSPLLAQHPLKAIDELVPHAHSIQAVCSASIESIDDRLGPPIKPDEDSRGGSHLLKLQAQCPFRAFAEIRLGAEGLVEAYLGLSPADRGLLLHQCLEAIWRELQSQETLLSLSEQALSNLCQRTCARVVKRYAQSHPGLKQAHFQAIEIDRLSRLVERWLQHEKQRPPFKVLAVEKSIEIEIGGLKLQLRVDRIDQVGSDNKLIIDHKTGLVNVDNCFGERLEEPQLPLYALTQEEVIGITFAQIRIDVERFVGISGVALDIPGISALKDLSQVTAFKDWEAVTAYWQKILARLAESFVRGEAAVDPKDLNVTCQYCALPSLCRIFEQTTPH